MRKRMLNISLVGLLLCFVFTACGKTTEEEQFLSYLGQEENEFTFANGLRVCVASFEKEDSFKPKVVIWVAPIENGYEKTYDWMCESVSSQRDDLKIIANKVISYAKEQKWDNDYYLYVRFGDDRRSYVYDYEADEFWIPNCAVIYKRLYEKFKTFNLEEISQKEGGKNYLLDNGLAEIKHGEMEFNYPKEGYYVYISNDEFHSFGEDDSQTIYE